VHSRFSTRIPFLVLALCCAPGVQAQIAGTSACAVTANLQGDPDDFYPPGSIRRAEEGEVIIAILASPGDDQPRDIRIVRSSGFPDLDNAALKLVRRLRVSSPCSAKVARWAVHFDHEPDDTPAERRFGCLVHATTNVLLVADETPVDQAGT